MNYLVLFDIYLKFSKKQNEVGIFMKKILAVDNDQFILEFLKELFEKRGYEIVVARDGLSALDVLDSFTPDVIFTDVVMPNIDGRRLCRIVKRMDHLRDVCIVVLSSIAEENADDIVTWGVHACIPKAPLKEMLADILDVMGRIEASSRHRVPTDMHYIQKLRPRAITRELLRSERHLELVLNRLTEPVFEIMPGGRITYVNRAGMLLTDLAEEDLLGQMFYRLFQKQDQKRIEKFYRELETDSLRFLQEPLPVINGHEVLLEVIPIPDDSDRKRVAIINDVTQQLAAEKALKKGEERYRLLFENANDAIFVVQDGIIKFSNRRTLEGLMCEAEDLSRTPFENFIHPEDRSTVLERHSRRLKGENLLNPVQFRGIRKTGEIFWGELNAVNIDWEGRPATLNFLRDVTERIKTEAKVRQSQRMESLGKLAGGIAHDFNNLLMAIQGNASLILLGKKQTDPEYARLKNIEEYVKSGSELTRQLLGFARGGKYESKATNMNEVIRKSAELFGRTRKEIQIHAKYHDDLWSAEVDRGQMDQVLMNLYINAWQAMPGGGDLFLETRNAFIENACFMGHKVPPGEYVEISVSDTGEGIDPEILTHIFEPFFTTRESGRGTGLGLASVYGIVKNHSGFIDVQSIRGEGSKFTIILPACKQKLATDETFQKEVRQGKETILLVDDEEMVLDIGKDMLEALGYTVFTAGSGASALECLKEYERNIDLVILDMVMPGMNGGNTYNCIREMKHDVKVLLSSGYSMDGQAAEIMKQGCDGFIQKPFHIGELSRRLGSLLGN